MVLRRWEEAGAVWRVVSSSEAGVVIALMTCSAGEEVGRLRSADPEVLAHVAGRDGSD
ncbi:MAG TPA: hypothetical protein VF143_00875 [Candidatus Nanopelagicales bacterium]